MKLQHFKELVSNISREYIVGETMIGDTTIVKVKEQRASLVALISGSDVLSFNTNYDTFDKESLERKEFLLDVIIKFSSTPISERKDGIKYHWLTKDYYSLVFEDIIDKSYLNLINDESICIDTKTELENPDYRTLFTIQEFWEIVERFRLDIDEFEKELPEED